MTGSLSKAAQIALSRRMVLCGAGALSLSGLVQPAHARSGQAADASTPYPIDAFFPGPHTRSASLSPSGRRIAVLQEIGTEDEPHGVVDLIAADDPEGERKRVDLGPIRAEAMDWGNDDRLLIRVAITNKTDSRSQAGSNVRVPGVEFTSRRVISIGADRGDVVLLFQDQRNRLRRTFDMGRVIDMLPNDPDHVLMTAWEADGRLALHRVNINTGSASIIERGNTTTYFWNTQDGVPVLRHDINARGTMETVFARMPGETEWKLLRRSRVQDAPDFSWVGETDRPGTVLVSARAEGEDTESIRELDLGSLAVGPPISGRPGRDVLYGLKDTAGRYMGAAYYGARLEYDFSEPALAPLHAGLNRFFDNDCDVHLTDVDADRNRFILHVTGPTEPGAWFFYDKTARAIVNVGAVIQLDIARLGATETVTVRTRDGAEIEAYLTAPPGGRAGPLVVLPHGGPEIRDTRAWDTQVQVLAAQGWWVLRPNFRGSGGYGLDFARQGWTRWGERMQEDVEDAVAQVTAAKGLDGGRVAIMGTSYGGYAALMGAVRRPELYKACIAICGVADLPDMLAWENREDDTPGKQIYDFWTKRIGDPETAGASLAQASPRRRASEIACPVLLVHGEDDGVVPVIQSRRMREALRSAGKSVELIEIEKHGHADWPDAQEKALMSRYVALLKRAFA
jgi:dipeptidyl aminopeptidase/acylaminoacyl peptidase